MSVPILQEDDILDRLNQQVDLHNLLRVAIDFIHMGIEELIVTVFRKEHHAVNFVIPSLIGKNGPLNDMPVRLKLLYALGLLSREEYEDIELLSAMFDELNNSETQYQFTDDEILGSISLLHDMVLPPNTLLQSDDITSGIIHDFKSAFYQNRYQQAVRSAFIIAITELTLRIINKQRIDYFP